MSSQNLKSIALPKVNIGGKRVKAAMSETQSASMLLQAYTHTVLATPDIKLPAIVDTDSNSNVVEELPKFQAIARKNATFYIDNLNQKLVKEVTDIIGFANLWNAEYEQLLNLAKNIDSGKNKSKFNNGIKNLINLLEPKDTDISEALTALNDFQPKIEKDHRNFDGAENDVTIALGGEKGEIAELKKRIKMYHKEINDEIAIIIAGAAGDVVGAILIIVGLGTEFESAGTSTGLVITGVTCLAGGTVAMTLAGKKLSSLETKLDNATKDLAVDKLCLSSTQTAKETIKSLTDAVQKGITALTNLQKGWQLLNSDFDQIIQQLKASNPNLGTWLVDALEAGNEDWKATLRLAKSLEKYGILPSKKQKLGQS